jgi:predicted nuclease of predicted toxin-antitoxin system
VSLLLDENLSPRLVPRLASLFPGLIHVRDVNLNRAPDREIWDWARANRYTVVTADTDFVTLSQRLGWPPKVVHIEQCDFPFRTIERLLRQNAVRISELAKDPHTGLMVVRVAPGFRPSPPMP